MKRLGFLFLFLTGCLAGVVLWCLPDHDLDTRTQEQLNLTIADHQVTGTLWLPDQPPIAALALVHGDGPQDRTSSGGYAPLIQVLLDRGIAVAAWDKQGVGGSTGNWLRQDMADRAAELRHQLRALERRFDGLAIGALGFSQAGWVVPQLMSEGADFAILIGAAVSWQDQGAYYTRRRLEAEGLSEAHIIATIAAQSIADDLLFAHATRPADAPADMSVDRWNFIRSNRHASSRDALARLDLPLLAIWGANDLNVDPQRNSATFRELLETSDPATKIIVWPDASHSLLSAPRYNWQLVEHWPLSARLAFFVQGRAAYAPGVLDTIANWVTARAGEAARR